ncbi:MAG: hypothetical protein GX183_03695 [Firmicutes bacterium]|jgi:stress-induced morphogen|nr:hypothetical protein [Bacillota bacterium]
MWGPVTHPYIAYQAFRKAKDERGGSANPEIMEAIEHHTDTYIYAANSPDAISTNNVLFNIIIYDYAHNNMPDRPDGTPLFGYRLVVKALERLRLAPRAERERYEKELAFACGWLTHQVSDWVAHYREVEREIRPGQAHTFYGYANSHQVLSPYFHHEILAAKRDAEHALTEIFHDAHIMLTDESGRFGPGRLTAYLPIDEDDNLISLVSETFAGLGCSKIPSKHLRKLRDDFDIVIRGIQVGVLLVKTMQPQLAQIVKAFVESNQRYVDESIQRVIDRVLMPSEAEILEEANRTPGGSGATTAVSIVHARPESVLHRLAFSLGKSLTPENVDSWLTRFVLRRACVRRFLASSLAQYGGRAESTRALVNFASVLISASKNTMEAARDAYCTNLRPVAAVDAPFDQYGRCDSDGALKRMVDDGAIKIRFTPAKRTDKNSTQYLLDPGTAVIRVNGYLPDEKNAPFSMESRWDETGEILECEVRLHPEARSGECLHLFADISDRRNEHSQYIDKQVQLEAQS